MSNGLGKGSGALIKHEVLNPQVRPSKREGKLLVRGLRRSLKDPEAALTLKRVRDQVFFHASTKLKGGKTVGFAGPQGGEGTTTLSILLGLSLGELRQNRVIFIDGKLERKNFALYSEMFTLTKNALSYNNGCGYFQCYATKNQNLCFLTPGSAMESMEFFSTEEISHLLSELREAFDYIIFDMPPILRSSETRMLVPHLDLFFLVCSSRRTTFSEVERSQRIVGEAGGSIQGVVLNRQRAPFWASFFGRDTFF